MAASVTEKTKLTPPELARRWGISCDKVLSWIQQGELRAINASTKPSGRPRYLIDEADIAAFEEQRAVVPPPKPSRRRKKKESGVIKFF